MKGNRLQHPFCLITCVTMGTPNDPKAPLKLSGTVPKNKERNPELVSVVRYLAPWRTAALMPLSLMRGPGRPIKRCWSDAYAPSDIVHHPLGSDGSYGDFWLSSDHLAAVGICGFRPAPCREAEGRAEGFRHEVPGALPRREWHADLLRSGRRSLGTVCPAGPATEPPRGRGPAAGALERPEHHPSDFHTAK